MTMPIPEIPKRPGVEAVEWNLNLDALDLHIPHPAIQVSGWERDGRLEAEGRGRERLGAAAICDGMVDVGRAGVAAGRRFVIRVAVAGRGVFVGRKLQRLWGV